MSHLVAKKEEGLLRHRLNMCFKSTWEMNINLSALPCELSMNGKNFVAQTSSN